MTQLSLFVNSMPRDLTEFAFFITVVELTGLKGRNNLESPVESIIKI